MMTDTEKLQRLYRRINDLIGQHDALAKYHRTLPQPGPRIAREHADMASELRELVREMV